MPWIVTKFERSHLFEQAWADLAVKVAAAVVIGATPNARRAAGALPPLDPQGEVHRRAWTAS